MQPHDQFHVLADCRGLKTAGIDDCFSTKEAECAGNDQKRIEEAECDAAAKERAQIFDHLKAGEQVSWDSDLRDASVLYFATIGDADDAAARERVIPREKRYDHMQ